MYIIGWCKGEVALPIIRKEDEQSKPRICLGELGAPLKGTTVRVIMFQSQGYVPLTEGTVFQGREPH